jgi:RimJ/RimL family protein N-acetyltransferase
MPPNKQIVPFNVSHVFQMEMKPMEQEFVDSTPDFIENLMSNANPDYSWTGVADGKIVAIFGVSELWPGVADLWMIPSVHINKHAMAVVRGAKAVIDKAVDDFETRRLQITVREDNQIAYRFARALGFDVECLMKSYGPEGADYYLMSRIKECLD